MKIRIVSDGSGRNTRVYNESTGETIEWVTKVEWKCSVTDDATLKIHMVNVPINVVGRVVRMCFLNKLRMLKLKICRQKKRITIQELIEWERLKFIREGESEI